MARTKADAGKKAGGKAPRKAPVLRTNPPPKAGGGVTKRKSAGSGGRNGVCKRPIPKWQVPIGEFLNRAGSSKDSSAEVAAQQEDDQKKELEMEVENEKIQEVSSDENESIIELSSDESIDEACTSKNKDEYDGSASSSADEDGMESAESTIAEVVNVSSNDESLASTVLAFDVSGVGNGIIQGEDTPDTPESLQESSGSESRRLQLEVKDSSEDTFYSAEDAAEGRDVRENENGAVSEETNKNGALLEKNKIGRDLIEEIPETLDEE